MWWWYLYYPLHYIDHFFLTIFHKVAFLRNWILPVWVWFTAHLPFVSTFFTRVSHQHYYLSRMNAISHKWYYMGKSIVIADPDAASKVLAKPPPQLQKGWIVGSIQESGFIAPVFFSTPHSMEDIELCKDIIGKAWHNNEQAVIDYINTLTWKEIKGVAIMDVYEHCMFIMFFNNKLTPERRVELFRAITNLLKIGIIFLALIPSRPFANLLGLDALCRRVRKKFMDDYIKVHNIDLNDPVAKHRSEIFDELFTLNAHAPVTTLPYWIMDKIAEHWDYVKGIEGEVEMFQFYSEALRLRVAPPDIGWAASEDFTLDLPELGQKIFVPKGFGVVVPTCAVNLCEKTNPDPFNLKYRWEGRNPKNNIIFGYPLRDLDYIPTRGCAGAKMAEWLIPKILLRYTKLKLENKH